MQPDKGLVLSEHRYGFCRGFNDKEAVDYFPVFQQLCKGGQNPQISVPAGFWCQDHEYQMHRPPKDRGREADSTL